MSSSTIAFKAATDLRWVSSTPRSTSTALGRERAGGSGGGFTATAAALLLLLASSGATRAQTEDAFGDSGADPVKLFERGQTAHARGDFQKAIELVNDVRRSPGQQPGLVSPAKRSVE